MDRLGQFETMKQQYEELLETDSASLLKAGLALQVLDASIASGIAGAAATVTGNSGVSSVDSIHATYDQVTGDDMSRAYKRA